MMMWLGVACLLFHLTNSCFVWGAGDTDQDDAASAELFPFY